MPKRQVDFSSYFSNDIAKISKMAIPSQTSGTPELAALVSKRIQSTGLSLKEVAEKAELNSSHLSLIKSGKRGISEETARKLAGALNRDPEKLEQEIEDLLEAAQSRSNRMVSVPVVLPKRAFSFTVPPHYFNVLARLERKIGEEALLNKEALIDFERNWRRGGTIYVYAEKDERKGILEMHDIDFRRLTVDNILQRKITYHFFTSDELEATGLARQLYSKRIDKSKLHIYWKSDATPKEEVNPPDPFAKKRNCIMYIDNEVQGDEPGEIVYEKVLDDPLFFDRVDTLSAEQLRSYFEEHIGNNPTSDRVHWQKLKA